MDVDRYLDSLDFRKIDLILCEMMMYEASSTIVVNILLADINCKKKVFGYR